MILDALEALTGIRPVRRAHQSAPRVDVELESARAELRSFLGPEWWM